MSTMRKIWISQEVWNEIAKEGHFGETEDDVLRRLLKVDGAVNSATGPTVDSATDSPPSRPHVWKQRIATDTMRSGVRKDQLFVEFASGPNQTWALPSRSDKKAIRAVRGQAVEWVRQHGGTQGQQAAVMRHLTQNGYHITSRPDHYE